MSKRIDAHATCPDCNHRWDIQLYRSLWIEDCRNRQLIEEDKINVVKCPQCGLSQRIEYPFLCTNVKDGIAIWYEPYPDPEIDKDVILYSRQFGQNSFYVQAPRVRNWQEFKSKLTEMEGARKKDPFESTPSLKAEKFLKEFTTSLGNKAKNENESFLMGTNSAKWNFLIKLILPTLSAAFIFLASGEYFYSAYELNDYASLALAIFVAGILGFLTFIWQKYFIKNAIFGFSSRLEKGVKRISIVLGTLSALPFAKLLWESIDSPNYVSIVPYLVMWPGLVVVSFICCCTAVCAIFWCIDGFMGKD